MKKMKKVLFIHILWIIQMCTLSLVYAADTPSAWAQKEVNEAIANHLIPEELQGNYGRPITRGEYVLLGLRFLEINGKNVQIDGENPFSDILNDDHEKEIIDGYYAGIIDGYEDGTFKPNQEITREEISALVVKLLKQIEPNESYTVQQDYQYEDQENIGGWAKMYIDYCYEQGIIKGVSEGVIQPKGKATIEQSIILIYRLAMEKSLIENQNSSTTQDSNDEKVSATPEEIDEFLEWINTDTTNDNKTIKAIKTLINDQNLFLMDVQPEGIVLNTQDNGMINIVQSKYEITLYAYTRDLNDADLIEAVKNLLETMDHKDQTIPFFESSIKNFETDLDYHDKLMIQKDIFDIHSENMQIEDRTVQRYYFVYHDTIE